MKTIKQLGELGALAVVWLIAATCDGTDVMDPSHIRTVALSAATPTGIVDELAQPQPRVRVFDAKGRPAAFAPIRFVVKNGGGRIAQADTITDARGEAGASWVFGRKVTSNVLLAYSGSESDGVFFTAVPVGGPPVRMVVHRRTLPVAPAGSELHDLSVTVLDRFDNPSPAVDVTFSVRSGGGILGNNATTDRIPTVNGTATLRSWRIGQAGINRVIAAFPAGDSVVFEVLAIDTASASVYTASLGGQSETRLTLTPDSAFVEELRVLGASPSRSITASGRYSISGATITFEGCIDDWYYGLYCSSWSGRVDSDGITIGNRRYALNQPGTGGQSGSMPAFPDVTARARIYAGVDSPYYAYHNSRLASRYVLYDDLTFELQYASARWGVFTYKGRYSSTDSQVAFDWDGWSVAGAWGATATMRGDSLIVRYNTIMQLSDFEDGTYVRQRHEE